MTAAIRNNHARLITLFLWKVPKTATVSYDGALPNRLSLNNSSGSITIPLSAVRSSLKSVLMGSREDISIIVTGYDEIGRQVSVPVRFQ